MFRHLGFVFAICCLLASAASHAGSISGFVFNDADRDGLRGPSEAGVRGIELTLLGAEGTVRRTELTAADGGFTFADLPDGDYLIAVPEFPGVRASVPSAFALPQPIPNFPVGSSRYSSPAGLIRNIEAADQQGGSPLHVGLGDSIGFGFNLCGSILGEDGYYEPTTDRLRRAAPRSFGADKQSYPGDETNDLLDPDVDLLLFSNDVFYAVDEEADLVSISIGGNDFLGAEDGGDAELAEALVIARRNIQEILSSLVGELPDADIEINTVYDNLEGDDALHNTWVPIWNQVLRELAWGQARRVTIAEVYPEYAHDENGTDKGEPGLICSAFGLDDIHPTNRGYDVHEEKLWQSFGGVTLSNDADVDSIYFGLQRSIASALPSETEVVAGGVTSPELALVADGQGALVESGDAELRVSDFLQFDPPDAFELVRAVVSVTYRTTGAPLDDYYVFEASVDGSFSEPGSEPDTWNTIVPLVGSSGNGGAERLAYPDQPAFRTVTATLTLGAPRTSGEPTLTLADLDSLSVRLVTTAVGTPDAFSVEWDATAVELFVKAAENGVVDEPVGSLTRTERNLAPAELTQGLGESRSPSQSAFQAAESLLNRDARAGTRALLELAAAWPPERRAVERLRLRDISSKELLAALSDVSPTLRTAAANAWGHSVPTAATAPEALVELFETGAPAERFAARLALARSGDKRALQGIEELKPRLQIEVLELLPLPGLERLLALAEAAAAPPSVRLRAARSLALVDQPTPAVTHALRQLTASDSERVSRLAHSGLRRFAGLR